MNIRLFCISAVLALAALAARAQTPAQQYLEQNAGKGPMQGTLWGVSAVDAQGKTLASLNADTRMVPASNLKLVTTGAALHAFGPDHRFLTGIGYTGTIGEDGTLEGDVYILGGGDPTLGARDSIAYRPDALFWKWKSLLKEAGIRRIHGSIVGDGSAWEGHLENAAWNYDDVGTYYGAGSDALCFYQNAVDLQVAATQEGQPVSARQSYPQTPWMHFTNYGVTGPAGSGNSLYLFTTDLAPYAELRGSFAVDRKPKTEHFANKFGALTCASYFWKNLTETGWEVSGGYAYKDRSGYLCGPDFVPGKKAGTPARLGATESPRLRDIVRITNERSDNFYAESLLRAMGEAATGNACYDSCLVAVREVLQDLGLPEDGLHQADGSGLSRSNTLSARWMTDFLGAMQKSPAFPAFLASLPAPGEGTLQSIRITGGERIRMKSGSMGGVLCYSGYILDDEGRPAVTFSILTNNATASPARLRSVLTGLLLALMPRIP